MGWPPERARGKEVRFGSGRRDIDLSGSDRIEPSPRSQVNRVPRFNVLLVHRFQLPVWRGTDALSTIPAPSWIGIRERMQATFLEKLP